MRIALNTPRALLDKKYQLQILIDSVRALCVLQTRTKTRRPTKNKLANLNQSAQKASTLRQIQQHLLAPKCKSVARAYQPPSKISKTTDSSNVTNNQNAQAVNTLLQTRQQQNSNALHVRTTLSNLQRTIGSKLAPTN